MNPTERDNAVYALLVKHAEAGKACPTNVQMGAVLGLSDGTVSNSVTRLKDAGLIAVVPQRGNHHREVTIVATGAKTAPKLTAVGVAVERKPEPNDKFSARMRKVGGKFEDHPSACRPIPRFRMLPPPTEVLREAHVGLAGSAHRGGVRGA
jgi:DNA-binding transcriptional ArsR family regulator